jgi:hypothetical protein
MIEMWTRPITVSETAVFVRQAPGIWSDEEQSDFVDFIARNPEAGDVIPDSGGVARSDRDTKEAGSAAGCG